MATRRRDLPVGGHRRAAPIIFFFFFASICSSSSRNGYIRPQTLTESSLVLDLHAEEGYEAAGPIWSCRWVGESVSSGSLGREVQEEDT